jgi:hypothetical protein
MKAASTSLLILTLVLTACMQRQNISPRPSISDDAKAKMNKPVNCATAQQDIAALEDEKASVAKQVVSGVRSVVPFSAAAGLVMGDYQDRVEVSSGQYNADLQAKIDQIKMTCGISS